jgi:hypothetical protein
MYPITGIAGGCARAASGHAAAPPSSVMKSRRFTAQCLPVLQTESIAHLGPAGGAALQDFDLADNRNGSNSTDAVKAAW